jgi:hypothetical protein
VRLFEGMLGRLFSGVYLAFIWRRSGVPGNVSTSSRSRAMFKFKSKAAADLIMLNAHGQVVLQAWGKAPTPQGVLLVQDMASAITGLQHYAAQHDQMSPLDPLNQQAGHSPQASANGEGGGGDDGTDNEGEASAGGGVSWSVRFAPLVAMLQQCLAEQTDVTWHVT